LCSACKICHPDATMVKMCEMGSITDEVECTCNPGYHGNGLICRYYDFHFV
jgi:hypothetical protein